MFSPQSFIDREHDETTGKLNARRTLSPQIGILGTKTFSNDGNGNRKPEAES